MEARVKKILVCLFFLYGIVLAEILFVGREAELSVPLREYFVSRANLVPFRTIIRYVKFFLSRMDRESVLLAAWNLGGNFLLFMPMGFFLPVLLSSEKAFGRTFGLVFLTVFAAEVLQGVLRVGVPDVDDLVTNMAGACVGMLLSKKIQAVSRA